MSHLTAVVQNVGVSRIRLVAVGVATVSQSVSMHGRTNIGEAYEWFDAECLVVEEGADDVEENLQHLAIVLGL